MQTWVGSAGVCVNKENKLLMVLQGKPEEEKMWSVPSGGREAGETFEECCIREVMEETGYDAAIINKMHVKEGNFGDIAYQVHYFMVEVVGGEAVIQDPDELIYEISWKSYEDMANLNLSFPEDRAFLMNILSRQSLQSPKYSTLLFDFDGTLADTLPICIYAFQKVFQKYDGRSLTNEEIKDMFGPSEVGIIQNNLNNQTNANRAIEDYYFYYEKEHTNLVLHSEAIQNMLSKFKNQGVKMGIVTGKARRSYEISLKSLGLEGLFEVSITGDDVIQPKPHPEGVIKAMSLLNSFDEETLFIGDSHADIEAGQRAGIFTVGVLWLENSHEKSFTSISPDIVFTHVDDFMEYLKGRTKGTIL